MKMLACPVNGTLSLGRFLGKADAALAASIFHYNEFSIGDVKKYLDKHGIPIRR